MGIVIKGNIMQTIEKSIKINAPVSVVYNQWTQFEDFPKFMEGVESVSQIDDTHLHWISQMFGKQEEWDAEIFDQVPDKKISWRSISGPSHSGTVFFMPLKKEKCTKVTLSMGYEPRGLLEKAADALGLIARRVEGDLERFKQFIESRLFPTGAWRGEIHGRKVQKK
jgi:uncharacterized membrane protein